ncbi:hypothetical protein ASE86_07110 [Sphingomonas sp. Leaf33]|uniref:hypothetical protein n=1 Tax=Sphingomonas sp. Leaf33 TaxID=1736215 RepID=UPI0006FC666D|nr:hypothetical protein [Sphingomonas sp. Leaf33]KQN25943.1 hypothetical protein ASE86_07110 [Sphingomonas sp. Leaf33]
MYRMTAPDTAAEAYPFTPVPIARARHDGWSPERQRCFIAALAELGSVHAAARSVGSSRAGVDRLRRRSGAESFAAAWDAALAEAHARLFEALFQRATVGVLMPRKYRGGIVGFRHFHDNAAGLAALREPPLPPHLRRGTEQR